VNDVMRQAECRRVRTQRIDLDRPGPTDVSRVSRASRILARRWSR
jgi:hypothetical protein